jgi:biotin carboxylase
VRLLLVAPSSSYRLGDYLDAAAAVGCAVTVAADTESAIPGALVTVAFDDPVGAAEQLVATVGVIDGVVGTDGDAVAVAAAVARLVGMPTNDPQALATASDKHQQRLAAASKGVPQPEFILVDEAEAGWSMLPAVVKPLTRSGSQGVLRAETPIELDQARRRVKAIVGNEQPVLVERFVPGIEVAVEGLLRGGHLEVLAVFDKPDTPQGPTFPETLLVSPARLALDALGRVVDVAGAACAAVGLVEGPVHVECKVDGSEVWFLELAARTIGGLCGRALEFDGVRLEELVIRHALGLPRPPPSPAPQAATGVLMLPVATTGRLYEVRGTERARAVKGVTDVVISIGAGEEVVALPEGDRYLGFVFARGGTPDEVEIALRQAWAALEVDISAW